MNHWELNQIDQRLIELALREDLGPLTCDATTQLLFAKNDFEYCVTLFSKEQRPLVFCGLDLLAAILSHFQTDYRITTPYHDGDIVPAQSTLLTIQGKASTLLMAERILLNFIRHLSAIATLTKQFVEMISHTTTKILDTRKTTPGWRHLEKYAVHCGGGVNHRLGLYDAIMIKDTHIDLLGGMQPALAKLPTQEKKQLPVIVEVRDETELALVLRYGQGKVDRVLLDNMSPTRMANCVTLCSGIFATEASGNINLETIQAIAESGVDYASVGMLTHSASQVDISMQA